MREKKSTYIILLRAVNVSGKNILKMAAFQAALADAGFAEVKTYIQSGNAVLKSSKTASEIKTIIETLLSTKFGLNVTTFVVDTALLDKAIRLVPFSGELLPNRLFITVLDQAPNPALLASLQAVDHGEEQFDVLDNILYFYLPEGAAKAKMSNNYFERKLQLQSTGRNLNTFQKLRALAQASEQASD